MIKSFEDKSFVKYPSLSTSSTAFLIILESSGLSRVYSNIIAKDSIIAYGFTIPWPAISGADPCIGSNIPVSLDNEAEGNSPIEPVNIDAASDKISPNKLGVKITSNC